jgi:hypothetical protein
MPLPHLERIVGMRLGLTQFLAPGPRRFHGPARREHGIDTNDHIEIAEPARDDADAVYARAVEQQSIARGKTPARRK